MSYEMHHNGGSAFNHDQSKQAEEEYDRLRGLAREEANKRSNCFEKSKHAYENGDGARAKQLSEEGKEHDRKMEQYNKQASEFIFRENNAAGRVGEDTIDLHGQFVEEAEDILEERIKYARQHGQTHLHVIVGRGNHSTNHIQKIKPRVEQVCRELGLQYAIEENSGRIYVNLTGGPAVMPPYQAHHPQQQQQPHYGGGGGGYPGQQGLQHQQQYPQQGQQHQQQQAGKQDELEAIVEKVLPRVLRKLGDCCVVM